MIALLAVVLDVIIYVVLVAQIIVLQIVLILAINNVLVHARLDVVAHAWDIVRKRVKIIVLMDAMDVLELAPRHVIHLVRHRVPHIRYQCNKIKLNQR